MKTNVVEFGTVIDTRGRTAKVLLDKGTSCRKCGMAALGLCRPGGSGLLVEVENPLGAKTGDRVKLGLKKTLHAKGYLLAFVLPLMGFVLASFVGYTLSRIIEGPALEVPLGLLGLGLSSYLGLKKLKNMDRTEKLHIEKVLTVENPGNESLFYAPEVEDYIQRFIIKGDDRMEGHMQ